MMNDLAGLVIDGHLAGISLDVELSACATRYTSGMFPAVFARWDSGFHYVPRLKTKMPLLPQAVAIRKTVCVRSAHLP
jgi:hypothetical protein